MITLEGSLEKIRFRNEATLFSVADLKSSAHGNLITVVGAMPPAATGQTVRVTGEWVRHPKYGQQFKIRTCESLPPDTAEGIRHYLASGPIRGIGAGLAERITAFFGKDTLHVIDNEPERLREVPGIGVNKAALIRDAWEKHRSLRELMALLQEKGVDPAHSARIFRTYGAMAPDVIREAPFQLADDIPGAGFFIADTIALNSGLSADDPERIRACVKHLIFQEVNAGHAFAYERHLLGRCETAFGIDAAAAEQALADLVDRGEVVVEGMPGSDPEVGIVYPAHLHKAETGAAQRIRALSAGPGNFAGGQTEAIMEAVVKRLAIQPSAEQLRVLEDIFRHSLVMVTGGPGTGKTTLIRAITAVLEASGKKAVLAAPTGRAAKRLAEVSGKKTATIHKLLGYSADGKTCLRNRDNPVPADTIIIDEASMVDLPLFYNLLAATPAGAVLVLVGDVFQLPPVGPGNVLSDLIRSEVLPVFYLTEIFRQAGQSDIITLAHQIRQGELPALSSPEPLSPETECCFIEQNAPEAVADCIVKFCTDELPARCGLDPKTDIQVLTPMHKGPAGTINLNHKLQKALNPARASGAPAIKGFMPGDKVMHLKNNYEKEIFNGDIGTIESVDAGRHTLSVNYYGRLVNYGASETDELSLAYAITVHKSQGSEYPVVILPVITQHYPMLQRNLLYTAVTRARRQVILIGTQKAVRVAVSKDNPAGRLSLLAARINPDLV